MRAHIIYIPIILGLCAALFFGYRSFQNEKEKTTIAEENLKNERYAASEKAKTYILTRQEIAELYKDREALIKAYENKTSGKVREIHTTEYVLGSVVHDTIFISEGVSDCCFKQVFEFSHGCVTNIVTYDPETTGITDSLFGQINIDRYILAERPRWVVFKPRFWNKKNWPTSVRVENNCGFEIKENSIFEIK